MSKSFVLALVLSILAIFSFVLSGIYIKESAFWFLLSAGFSFLGMAINQAIKDHHQRNVRNIILRELDPKTGYIVRDRMKGGVMSLIDLAIMEQRLADIAGPYPPKGFSEEKTDGRTFLIPDSKKLAIGHKNEFVFAPKLSET